MNNIKTLPIWNDVERILNYPVGKSRTVVSGVIVTEKGDIPILAIESYDNEADYGRASGDYIVIRTRIGMGTYLKDVYPYRHNLEIVLSMVVRSEKESEEPRTIVEKFKAVVIGQDEVTDGNTLDSAPKDQLNNMNIFIIDFQLLNRSNEVLRVRNVTGTWNNTNHTDFLLSVLHTESQKVLIDGRPALDAIDIAEVDNKKTHNNIIIPSGVGLVDLADYLQNRVYGLYKGDVGTYITNYDGKNTCFIYPLMNFDRFGTVSKKLVVFAIPTKLFEYSENTHMLDGDVLFMLAGDTTPRINQAENEMMDTGVGFRLPTTKGMMSKPVIMTEEGPIADRTRLMYEVANRDREDGVTFGTYRKPSNNPFKDYANIIRKSGMIVSVHWRNAEPGLIYPGMPCEYVFLKDGVVYGLKGIVQHSHTLIDIHNVVSVVLTLFVASINYNG